MNIEAIKNHMNYLKNDKYDMEFYIALLLYDILDVPIDKVTKEMIDLAYNIKDDYDSIYNEDLRDRIREEIEFENDYDLEMIGDEIEK
jgi:hypothetical protein